MVGFHPPAAREIVSPPLYFASLLAAFVEPAAPHEVTSRISQQFPQALRSEIEAVVQDLQDAGLLTTLSTGGRYDRHALYFDLLGLTPSESQSKLAAATVGLVGCGGIGSTSAMLLAAAGVGQLVISDGDDVEMSNLTRSILFEECDVGFSKVESATRRLQARNTEIEVRSVYGAFSGPEFLLENFSDCDLVLLSADKPALVHEWVDNACSELSIPYLNVGYVEQYGSVGPFTIPGETPCWACQRAGQITPVELNTALQAASYGPLNALVSSIAVNEVIRLILGLKVATRGRRLVVDSAQYSVDFFGIAARLDCFCTSGANIGAYDAVAEDYDRDRESGSANDLVLDRLVLRLLDVPDPADILDLGAGTGTIARELAGRGHRVTAVDASEQMLDILRQRMPTDLQGTLDIITARLEALPDFCTQFDSVLLNCVLDYVSEPNEVLARCFALLRPAGSLLVTVPHPLKDAGRWEKRRENGTMVYEAFRIENYFWEGPITKTREDVDGTVLPGRLTAYRRTTETLFASIVSVGFTVIGIHEPVPAGAGSTATHEKASRIPYFQVFDCRKPPMPS
jgi:molybdopterin/thiamine biosynthesis adenylyltransferase/SAM-dependent methyltransferase